MQTIPIGTVTVVMSDYHQNEVYITDKMGKELMDDFGTYFTYKLKQYNLENFIIVKKEWFRGCITIIISIGFSTALLGGGGLLWIQKILKDYKDSRAGLDMLLEDIKNVRVKLKKIFTKNKKKDQIEQLPALTSASPQVNTEMNDSVSIGEKAFFIPGEKIVLYDEKEKLYYIFTLSVMSKDLRSEEEIKTLLEKI